MATDRFVMWRGKVPSNRRILDLIRNYCGTADYSVNLPRVVVQLPGCVSFAFRGLEHPHEAAFDQLHQPTERRQIEVFIHEPDPAKASGFVGVDVITRHADRFTAAVADGLARVFEEAFDGEWD